MRTKRMKNALRALAGVALGIAALLPSTASPVSAAPRFANEGAGSPENLGPLDQVLGAAERHKRPECNNLTKNKLAALMLAPTWHETTGGITEGRTPHPMNLARNDAVRREDSGRVLDRRNQRLYYKEQLNTHGRVFWHPAAGMWQADDSGMGAKLASGKFRPYNTVATYIANAWCNNGGRAGPLFYPQWYGCAGNACVRTFNALYDAATDQLRPLDVNNAVNYWGGLSERQCRIGKGKRFSCYYVNHNLADKDAWPFDQQPGGGQEGRAPTPLARPFYQYWAKVDGEYVEHRVWLDADLPDRPHDVTATRKSGQNSRDGLTWRDASRLCDVTGRRGHC